MFYGCRQTSHIEKHTHDFETLDTLLVEKPRITDTILVVMDSVVNDTLLPFAFDSIAIPDTLFFPTDSLKSDSIRHDTLQTQPKKFTPKRSGSAIDTKVICSASDSVWRDLNRKKIFYFGNAEAQY